MGQGLLSVEATRSASDIPHSVEFLWTSDQLFAVTSTRQHTTLTQDRHLIHPAAIEPAIPESEWRQTNALDRTVNGIGLLILDIQYFIQHTAKSVINNHLPLAFSYMFRSLQGHHHRGIYKGIYYRKFCHRCARIELKYNNVN